MYLLVHLFISHRGKKMIKAILTVNIKEEGGAAILSNPIAADKEGVKDEKRLQSKIKSKFVMV